MVILSFAGLTKHKKADWLEAESATPPTNGKTYTQAYIPPDDVDDEMRAGAASVPSVSAGRDPGAAGPHVPNNFEGGVFCLNHYRRYFNLNTSDFFANVNPTGVFVRCVRSSDGHGSKADEIGDMYGPIWVTASVIFILFFSNTCSGLLVSWLIGGDSSYKYNFDLLTGAITLLYGYTFVIPTIWYLITVWYLKLGGLFSLSKLISVYGYANAAWIPAAILSIARGFLVNHRLLSNTLKWISVLLGGVVSGAGILLTVYPVTRDGCLAANNGKLAVLLTAALLAAHLGLIIAVKVSFFGDLSVV